MLRSEGVSKAKEEIDESFKIYALSVPFRFLLPIVRVWLYQAYLAGVRDATKIVGKELDNMGVSKDA